MAGKFPSGSEQKRAASAIDKICSYIEKNLTQDLSLVRLADALSG
ncbi:hypothetical protein [Paenibacillus riograndensis]|nr:hypothetical protein [Paenibacillus riograndensis]